MADIPTIVIEDAKVVFKRVIERRVIKGNNRSGVIASSVYLSCKRHGVPRSVREVAKMFGVTPTAVTKGYKLFSEILFDGGEDLDDGIASPIDFVGRFASHLKLGRDMVHRCRAIVAAIEDIGVVFKNTPPTIAATCVVFAGILDGIQVDRDILADVSGVSKVTINKCLQTAMRYHTAIQDVLHRRKFQPDSNQ
jgi:transcription initiation factor TFIIB